MKKKIQKSLKHKESLRSEENCKEKNCLNSFGFVSSLKKVGAFLATSIGSNCERWCFVLFCFFKKKKIFSLKMLPLEL